MKDFFFLLEKINVQFILAHVQVGYAENIDNDNTGTKFGFMKRRRKPEVFVDRQFYSYQWKCLL